AMLRSVPTTVNLPSANSISTSAASSKWAASRFPLAISVPDARVAGIRQYRIDAHMSGRDVVDADPRADHAEGCEELAIRRDIGADIRDHVQPQRQDFRVVVEGELDLA